MTTTTAVPTPANQMPVPAKPGTDVLAATLRMARWRDAVLDVQSAILSGGDVDAVLHTVADVVRDLVDADLATVAVPRVVGTSLVLRAAAGYRADDLRGAVFPVQESLSGQVLETGRAMHLADATRAANAYQPICELGDLGPTVLLPLERGRSAFGTLLVARRRGRSDFTDKELELLQLFACHASVAVEFCRSQEQLQRLETVEESERVARELHDTVLQRLFAVGLHLQTLSTAERGTVAEQLEGVLSELDETVKEIRSTVLENEPG
jgi:signal transduction histidine kinase